MVFQKTFRVGDKVEWKSQSAGRMKLKRGEVRLIVPCGILPANMRLLDDARYLFHCGSLFYTIAPRDHESYIVVVDSEGGGKSTMYWPRVRHLERVAE